jgi:hypothetical protein
MQDKINGGFDNSWHKALRAIAHFTQYLPREGSFASLGCVMQRDNIGDIEDVIRFGTAISWFTSLVPIHVTDNLHPRGFRTFDHDGRFLSSEYPVVDSLIERIRDMRHQGYLLYDSDQYLDDIKRFVRNEPTTWRNKNNGVCDSPNLYFAVLPNGEFAPCCDYRMNEPILTYANDFPKIYWEGNFREKVAEITVPCEGCMYGSYPEMTISMRFMAAKVQRLQTFFTAPPQKEWPLNYEQLLEIAESIRSEPRARPHSNMRHELGLPVNVKKD